MNLAARVPADTAQPALAARSPARALEQRRLQFYLAQVVADAVLLLGAFLLAGLVYRGDAFALSTFLPAHRIRPVTRVEDLEALRNILELYSPRYVIVGYEQSVASAEALAAESPPVLKHLGNVAGARVYERLTRAP